MQKILLLFIASVLFSAVFAEHLSAQEQNASADSSLVVKSKVKSPRKASLYSAVLPGAGQIYNGKIWKAPLVWGGMGAFGYMAYQNHSQFMRFKTAYLDRKDGGIDEFYDVLTYDGLVNEMDRYRRYRDLNIIGATLFYVIQIVDANVDASLSDFDVGDDLSLRLAMPPMYSNLPPQTMSVSLTWKF